MKKEVCRRASAPPEFCYFNSILNLRFCAFYLLNFYRELSFPNPNVISIYRMYFYFKHGVSMWSESPVWHSSDFLRKRSLSSVFLSESESSNTSNSCLFLKESCSNSSWNITDYRKFKKLTIYKLSYGYDISLLNSVWHVCLLMIAVLDFGDVCPQVSAFKLLSI